MSGAHQLLYSRRLMGSLGYVWTLERSLLLLKLMCILLPRVDDSVDNIGAATFITKTDLMASSTHRAGKADCLFLSKWQ